MSCFRSPFALFTFVLLTIGLASVQGAESPNILFILADDVGIEPLGCYGGTSFKTPHLDQMAAAGMRFEHCYSMPVCHPTRVCFLTGRYPSTLGNPNWGSFPAELEPQTIANIVRRSGYVTAVAGKWQLAKLGDDLDHPHRLGFDQYCLFGWHEGGRYHDPLIWQNGTRRTDTKEKYGPDVYVEFLVDFIRQNRDRKFFAFYSMALCHAVTDDLDQPVPYPPGMDRYMNYGEMVRSMDDCVGRLIGELEDLGLRNQTLVVFVGDNGTPPRSIVRVERSGDKDTYVREAFHCDLNGRRMTGGKGSLTDAGTHVPLLAVWQDKIPAGTVVNDLVDFSDFLPTMAELSAGAIPTGVKIDGVSFAGRLKSNVPSRRRWAYAEAKSQASWVRTQRWKLMNDGRFYDVLLDAEEDNDLADQPLPSDGAEAKALLESVPVARR